MPNFELCGWSCGKLDVVVIWHRRRCQLCAAAEILWDSLGLLNGSVSRLPHGALQGRQGTQRQLKGLSIDRFLLQNRWILVEFLPLPYPSQQSTVLDSKQIYAALKQSVIVNFGDTGWGAVGSSLNGTTLVSAVRDTDRTDAVKYFSPTTNICIIRVARDPHRVAWGAVTYLSSIDGQRYIPNVVHVSGQPILPCSSVVIHSSG